VRRIIAAVAALVAVVVIVIVLVSATSSSGPSAGKSAGTKTSNAPAPATRHKHHAAVVNPTGVNVAVLNGTASAGLAKRISDRLTGKGYQAGCVANAPTQTVATTQVSYFPAYRRDALAVARSLGLPRSDLAAISSATQAVPCAAPLPPITNSNVVVTIGADLAGTSGGGASAGGATSTTGGTATATGPAAGTSTAAVPPPGTGGAATGTGTNPTNTVG
jgi:hypothetical protein